MLPGMNLATATTFLPPMRQLFASLALLPLALAAQNNLTPAPPSAIKWVSLAEAQANVKKAPKPIMIDVYTHWCGPCKMLASKTFTDPKLAEYVNKNFYAVKFDAESGEEVTFNGKTYKNPTFNPAMKTGRNGTHELTQAIGSVEGRIAYPTVVYMNENLEIIAPVQGYMTPEQIEPILKYIGEGAYKKQDFPSYKAGFTGAWVP